MYKPWVDINEAFSVSADKTIPLDDTNCNQQKHYIDLYKSFMLLPEFRHLIPEGLLTMFLSDTCYDIQRDSGLLLHLNVVNEKDQEEDDLLFHGNPFYERPRRNRGQVYLLFYVI